MKPVAYPSPGVAAYRSRFPKYEPEDGSYPPDTVMSDLDSNFGGVTFPRGSDEYKRMNRLARVRSRTEQDWANERGSSSNVDPF